MMRPFRNGERLLFLSPLTGWQIVEVTGERPSGGAYVGDSVVEDHDIAGVVPAGVNEAVLLAAMNAIVPVRQAGHRQEAWDQYWEVVEYWRIDRLPGILPSFNRS